MSQYSRSKQSDKPKKDKLVPVKQIKTGFSALQKTVALVGSIMSILVATITINRYLNENSSSKNSEKPTEIRVVTEVRQEDEVTEQEISANNDIATEETTAVIQSDISSITSETKSSEVTAVEELVTEQPTNQ